jgi:hypothetical protein
MDNQDIADEIEALSSILCVAGEFKVKSSNEKEVILVIQPQQIQNHDISLTVILDPKSYLSSSPQLSVQVYIVSHQKPPKIHINKFYFFFNSEFQAESNRTAKP